MAPARQALLAELRYRIDRSIFSDSLPIRTESVTFSESPSAVVPGLIYHWARYLPPETDHAFYHVVVAERAGRLEVLRQPPDWGVAARGWRPADSDEAIVTCLELVNVLTDRQPSPPAQRAAADSTWVRSIEFTLSPEIRRRLWDALRTPSEAQHRSGYAQWTATVWVAQQSATATARRYRCRFPVVPQAGPGTVELTPIDSIGGGLPLG